MKGSLQTFRLARLGKELMRGTDTLHDEFLIRLAGKNETDGLWVFAGYFLEQLCTVHHWHAHIGHDGVEPPCLQNGQCLSATIGEFYLPLLAHRAQHSLKTGEHHRFVINKENSTLHAACLRFLVAGFSGRRMMKVVPLPISVSKARVPACFSAITVWAMNSPCPVPLPTGLVVKKGSKILDLDFSGMPVPVSPMRISTQSPSQWVVTVIVPLPPCFTVLVSAMA